VCPECASDLREPHALRCVSCDYDIAALVEERGLDNPGLCPECGDDLRDEASKRPGHALQHRFTSRNYVEYVKESMLRPQSVAALVWRTDANADRYTILNCAVSALACAPPITLLMHTTSHNARPRDDEILLGMTFIPIGLLLGSMVLAFCVKLFLLGLGAGFWTRDAKRQSRMATAIGSTWLLASPALMTLALVLGLFDPGFGEAAALLAIGLPALLMVLTAVRAMEAFQR
jgi:hypothetical protein